MRKTARAEPWTGTRTSTRAIFPSCGGGEEEEEEEGEAYHFRGRGEGAARVSEASGSGGGGEGERGLRLYTGAVLEARALLVREIEPMGRGAPAKPRKILWACGRTFSPWAVVPRISPARHCGRLVSKNFTLVTMFLDFRCICDLHYIFFLHRYALSLFTKSYYYQFIAT